MWVQDVPYCSSSSKFKHRGRVIGDAGSVSRKLGISFGDWGLARAVRVRV